jgi:hypothetical protein
MEPNAWTDADDVDLDGLLADVESARANHNNDHDSLGVLILAIKAKALAIKQRRNSGP